MFDILFSNSHVNFELNEHLSLSCVPLLLSPWALLGRWLGTQVNLTEACKQARVNLIYTLGGTGVVGWGITDMWCSPSFLWGNDGHPAGMWPGRLQQCCSAQDCAVWSADCFCFPFLTCVPEGHTVLLLCSPGPEGLHLGCAWKPRKHFPFV